MTGHRIAIFIAALFCAAINAQAQFGGTAGAFMLMGYGARGMGMGNACVAYTGPDALALHNPAASAFAETREVFGSYSALGLDRTLNVLAFTAPIVVYKKTKLDTTKSKDPAGEVTKSVDTVRIRLSTIGISVGGVFSGVSNIDARDADADQIGIVNTYENFYYGGFAIRFKPNISAGVLVRFFDAKLWEGIKSSGVAVDLGAIYRLNDQWQFGLAVQNLARGGYRWDTSPVYNQAGQVTEDKFPTLIKVGAAYHFGGAQVVTRDNMSVIEYPATAYAEIEQSTVGTTILRGGAEYFLSDVFVLRAGVDGYDLQNRLASQVKPSFGISVRPSFSSYTPSFHYAAILEPIAGGLTHVLSLGFQF